MKAHLQQRMAYGLVDHQEWAAVAGLLVVAGEEAWTAGETTALAGGAAAEAGVAGQTAGSLAVVVH